MLWSTADFKKLIWQTLPRSLRRPKMFGFLGAIVAPLQLIHEETLYKMQHDGRKIYLEKVLNEKFEVAGYDHQDHEATKKIYIEDIPETAKLYIHLDLESEVEFMEDADSDDDLFLDADAENVVSYSFIVFVPDSYGLNQLKVRALVDSYRYIGKKYIIQTYTL